jgi:hypothetical protein
MLRHLKPARRQQVHQEFGKLCDELLLRNIETKNFRDTFAIIKSRTVQLRDEEQLYYHHHRVLLFEKKFNGESYRTWRILLKCQSFNVRFNEDGTPIRLQQVSPWKTTSTVLTASTGDCRKRPFTEATIDSPDKLWKLSKKPRHNELFPSADEVFEYTNSAEEAPAPSDSRAAAK